MSFEGNNNIIVFIICNNNFQLKVNYESEGSLVSCYGVTKDPSGNDYLLVFGYNMLNYELINKLHNTLNGSINRNDFSVKTTELPNEIIETLQIIKGCANCKDKIRKKYSKEFHKLMSKMEKYLSELRKEE